MTSEVMPNLQEQEVPGAWVIREHRRSHHHNRKNSNRLSHLGHSSQEMEVEEAAATQAEMVEAEETGEIDLLKEESLAANMAAEADHLAQATVAMETQAVLIQVLVQLSPR